LSETTTEQDAEKVFAGIPIARFRAGWALLKGRKTETQGDPIGEKSEGILKLLRPVDQWSDEDLINTYDQNYSTKIFTELVEEKSVKEVVVGAGARIQQNLEPDTLKVSDWQIKPSAVMRLYFVFPEEFKQIVAKGTRDIVGSSDGFLKGLPVG
jgi:hypothetical protein